MSAMSAQVRRFLYCLSLCTNMTIFDKDLDSGQGVSKCLPKTRLNFCINSTTYSNQRICMYKSLQTSLQSKCWIT